MWAGFSSLSASIGGVRGAVAAVPRADRPAIPSPASRHAASVLTFGAALGLGRHTPVSPAVLADCVYRAGRAVVARPRFLADRTALLEARADRAAPGGGDGGANRRSA